MNAPAHLSVTPQIAALARQVRELCGDDEQAFADTLDGETDAVEAARRVVRYIHEQSAFESAVKSLADIYSARAKVYAERQASARAALFRFLSDIGQRTLPLPEATLSIVTGRQQIVGEPDVTALPDDLVRVKREPDRDAIKAALVAGRSVPGVTLSNGAPLLQVRSR